MNLSLHQHKSLFLQQREREREREREHVQVFDKGDCWCEHTDEAEASSRRSGVTGGRNILFALSVRLTAAAEQLSVCFYSEDINIEFDLFGP